MLGRSRLGLLVVTTGEMLLVVVGLLAVYWLLPIQDRFSASWLLRLVGGLLLTCVALAWEVRSIKLSARPLLRGIRALVTALTIFVLVFAITYLTVSRQQHDSFSEPLQKVSAIYFSVTVLTTVGFGDIVARTDLARIITTFQMVLDLIFIAVAGRLLLTTATSRLHAEDRPDD